MENEYASKGAVNTANALGGTALGIELLRALFGGGLGGGCAGGAVRTAGALAEGQLCASLMAENGALKAEKYADRNTADVYTALNARDNRIVDKLSNIEKWQAAEMAAAPLREQLLRQRIELLEYTLRRITSIGVPNGVLGPGVPPVAVIHPDAAVAAVPA